MAWGRLASTGLSLNRAGDGRAGRILGVTLDAVVFPRATKLLRHQRPASNALSPSVELRWLREQVDQTHLVLDAYGVPRTSAGKGSKGDTVKYTLAGRLQLMLGDPPPRARHAASNGARVMSQKPAVSGGAAQGDRL